MNKKYGVLSSSIDPQSLSLTVKGIIVAAIPFVIWFSKLQGWDLPEGDLNNLADGVEASIQQVGILISSVMVVYGLARKISAVFKK